MSVKEIREAMTEGKVMFGVKQAIKKKPVHVFIAKDTRDATVERLEAAGTPFDVLKTKADLAKELNLDFESEVISIC